LALGGAALWGFTHDALWRWPVLAVAPFLVLLPRFRPGSAAHCLTAGAGLFVLLGVTALALLAEPQIAPESQTPGTS
jgi:hypothetical protein